MCTIIYLFLVAAFQKMLLTNQVSSWGECGRTNAGGLRVSGKTVLLVRAYEIYGMLKGKYYSITKNVKNVHVFGMFITRSSFHRNDWE